MNDETKNYKDPRAVQMVIKSAAAATHKADPSRKVEDLIRQAYYDRFLSRVFSEDSDSEWVLKGGSGMLARVPNARRTLDADLYREGYDKDKALADLRRVAGIDLGDFFQFVYREHHAILADHIQPYTDGYRVTFDAFLGQGQIDTIKVDLSTHVGATDNLTVVDPANRLDIPKLSSSPYRLYPVANQIADKVCATLAEYRGGRPSSREKDLVDLVVIAVTQEVEAPSLGAAITSEACLRRLELPTVFAVPSTWGTTYTKLAKGTPAEPYSIDAAKALMARFINPVLVGGAVGTWHPETQSWT
jgi:hypothetical protein